MVTITLNGEPLEVPSGCTVSQLLEIAGLRSRLVAVEVNLNVIPKLSHATQVLQANDQVEIVTLVGGG